MILTRCWNLRSWAMEFESLGHSSGLWLGRALGYDMLYVLIYIYIYIYIYIIGLKRIRLTNIGQRP